MINRKFGIEVEATGLTHAKVRNLLNSVGLVCETSHYGSANAPFWKVQRDGSLRGLHPFELVSPILEGDFGVADMITAVRVIARAGATVNASCGFHVHIDGRDLDLPALKRVVKSYANNEDIFDALMPTSRRNENSHYTGSLFGFRAGMTDEQRTEAVKAFFARVDAATNVNELAQLVGRGNRYVKLNLFAHLEHGSIEFRHHNGTVNATKVKNWVEFCGAFVDHAANARYIRPWGTNRMTIKQRLRTVLKMIGRESLYEFYAARITELARNPEP
jgi:hypothetical protein